MIRTENFIPSEFACRCGCGNDWIHASVVAGLQIIRTAINAPLIVTSGARCFEHNKRVGGHPRSQHLSTTANGMPTIARAADVTSPNASVRQLFDEAVKVPQFLNGGIGVYTSNNFIHLDVRGERHRWHRLTSSGPVSGGVPPGWPDA